MRRESRRSEISSTGDGIAVDGCTSCLVGSSLATHSLVLAFVFGASLGAADNLGALRDAQRAFLLSVPDASSIHYVARHVSYA
jgi:hypothetical protein